VNDHVVRTVSRCFRQHHLLKGCIKSLPFVRAAVTLPLLHCKSIAVTVCGLVHLDAFWIACSLSSMLPSGCCAIIAYASLTKTSSNIQHGWGSLSASILQQLIWMIHNYLDDLIELKQSHNSTSGLWYNGTTTLSSFWCHQMEGYPHIA